RADLVDPAHTPTAALRRDRGPDPAGLAGLADLPPDPRRPRRPALPLLQVPLDDRRRGRAAVPARGAERAGRADLQAPQRPARHAGRARAAPLEPRRAAA